MPNQAGSTYRGRKILAAAEDWLPLVLVGVSAGFILLFLYTSLRRMGYPFSFDQVEGGMVTSVWRVAHGYPLYTAPSRDFVPYLYAPLYFYLAAALSKIAGAGYAGLRILSIMGSVGSFALIYAIIHGETQSRLAGIAGAGLFAACYLPLEGWFDLGRVDSSFTFFLLLAIYCTRRAPIVLAALVWLVAFQVKQTILPVAVLVLCAEWRRPYRMALGLVTMLAGFGASLVLIDRATGGWYTYYLFGTAKGLSWVARTGVLYIPIDLLQPFGLAFLVMVAALLCAPPAFRNRGTQFYLVVSFSIYTSIWYLRAHSGSAVNTLMPAYAWTSVLFGIAFYRLSSWLKTQPSPADQIGRVLLLIAASVQILAFLYNPGRFVPSAATRAARQQFEQQLRSLPGDIYVLDHSYDAILASKKPHAVIDAFGIILDSPPSTMRSAYIADFRRAADDHVYGGFVMDNTVDAYNKRGWLPDDFVQQYPVRLLAVGWDEGGGIFNQPEERWIYLPCSALDQASSFINADSVVSFGTCTNVPSLNKSSRGLLAQGKVTRSVDASP